MKQHPLTQILQQLAEQNIPADLDLRTRLHVQLETSKTQPQTGVFPMKPRFAQSRRIAAAVVLAVSLLVAGLLITPQGRAWALAALQFFTRAETDTRSLPTLAPTMVAAPVHDLATPLPTFTPQPQASLPFQATCGSAAYPRCSLTQIRELAGFPVKEAAALPADWEFVGATGGPEQVIVSYQSLSGRLELHQSPASSSDQFTWLVGRETVIESVTIGEVTGEYVQGNWDMPSQNSTAVTWNSDVPTRIVRWQAGEMRYTLLFIPAKSDDGIEPDRIMLTSLAASLTSISVEAPASTQLLKTDVDAIAAAAGFTVTQPSWLPERYAFVNAVHVPEYEAVCLYYRYPESEGAPTLAIIESSRELTLQDMLLLPQSHNGKQIDIPVHTETVTVGGATNGQALYASNGLDVNRLCNAQGLVSNHVLLWQSGEKSFVIAARLDTYEGRDFLTRLEMRRLAEGLTGVATISPATRDPEYLLSITDAEALAGFDILSPSRLPADVRFAYAAYRDADAPSAPYTLAQGSPEVVQVYQAATRDKLGRYHRYQFLQNMVSPNTLEELAQGGGEWVAIHGQPAIYSQSCWDDTATGGERGCFLSLSWLDNTGMRFDLIAYLPGALDKATFLAIAESAQ